ncbi:MAG: amidohydrolase family protein, partial [Flavobacteriaceae bacterium]
ASHGAHAVHCPTSNQKLACGGTMSYPAMKEAGVDIRLGTDGAASNNMLDLFAELRLASLLAKIKSSDPRALSAHQALRMVTIEGAKTLGLEKSIGSLEKGKKADLIAVDLNKIENNPVYHPESSLVYTSSGTAVTDSWVNGEPLLSEGKLCALDETVLLEIMREWSAKIKA